VADEANRGRRALYVNPPAVVTGIHPQAGHSSRDEKSLTIDGVVGPVVAATQLATLGLPTQRSQLPRRPASDAAYDQQHFEQGKPR